jgi:hypothetical protein
VPSTPNARSAFGKNRGAAVGECGRRRQLGVQVLEAARRKVVAELGVRATADPERMPGTEDVVDEARLGDLRRADRAAEPVVPFEHADVPAALREQCGAGERVDAAADEDGVVLRH